MATFSVDHFKDNRSLGIEQFGEEDDPCAPLENPPRLELVHIPKTGGTTLEMLAAESGGIAWSFCHWGDIEPCPDHPRRHYLHHIHSYVKNWHVPPLYYDDDDAPVAPFNPYRDANLFVVVRNPYDRAVSEFRYRAGLKGWNANSADKMNEYLLKKLQKVEHATPGSRRYFLEYGHFVPQYDFTIRRRSSNSNALIGEDDASDEYYERIPNMHIVHLERLGDEFSCLTRKYGLPIDTSTLTTSSSSSRANKSKGSLSAHNLTLENRHLIESIYSADFEEFGYEMMMNE